MSERSRIPVEVQRKIFFESGHRCAVCGESFPLERAHIIPWRESKDHSADNLICLCANCHQKADNDWDESTFRLHKSVPWILRRYLPAEDQPKKRTAVAIVIDMEIDSFDETMQRMLVYALAAFLNTSPGQVRVTSIAPGSIRVVIDLEKCLADKLVESYSRDSSVIMSYVSPLVIVSVAPFESSTDASNETVKLLKEYLGMKQDDASAIVTDKSSEHIKASLVEMGYALSTAMKCAIDEAVRGALVTCPRCLGSGYVDWRRIHELEMEEVWRSGFCRYCWARGTVPSHLPIVRNVRSEDLLATNSAHRHR